VVFGQKTTDSYYTYKETLCRDNETKGNVIWDASKYEKKTGAKTLHQKSNSSKVQTACCQLKT
jgi:hypothetical protein